MRFLAVDLGASSGRTIVGTIADGRIDLTETHRFENGFVDREDGKHWTPMALLGEIKTGIAKAREGGPLDGIGIDTWGVDYGLIGADGTLLDDPYAYRDDRTEPAIPAVYEQIPKPDLYGINGLQELPFNTIFQLKAEAMQRPRMLEQARHILFMPQLFSYLLTGVAACDYTIASTSGLIDARTRSWSEPLLDLIGVDPAKLGPVQMPGVQIGNYEGTPVYLVGGHDTASAVAAVPATTGGNWAFLSSGTWSLIGAELADPILTPEAVTADFTNEGGVDGSIRFLKNINGLWLIQECRRLWAEQGNVLSFPEIARAAEATAFPSVIDPNDPRYMAPDNMVETIQAHCRETGQRIPETVGQLARCCYESLAQAYRKQLDVLSGVTGVTYDRLHVVGGGCQADLLNRLTANACGIEVVCGPVEATAIGNLCVQAMANGQFADLAAVRQAIADAFPVTTCQPE